MFVPHPMWEVLYEGTCTVHVYCVTDSWYNIVTIRNIDNFIFYTIEAESDK